MRYAIVIYESPVALEARSEPEYRAAYTAYIRALSEAGVLLAGAGLQPAVTATTLRIQNGKRQVQDGPYADTKEELGGFLLIEVPDLDKALEWAARCPSLANGVVEVRPALPPLN
ncbi:MAG TPA: YciI family protein [Polyangiaceae bacterium]|nr:YciI family protein [Polyangiaceae bacterium]